MATESHSNRKERRTVMSLEDLFNMIPNPQSTEKMNVVVC